MSSAPKDRTILVVDDLSTVRRIVRKFLSGFGYMNIVEAENGQEALEKVLQGNIDLVICDWFMPRLTGIDLLKTLRADEKLKSLPFLMITANVKREDVVAAVEAGVSDFVTKPFNESALRGKVEKLLALQSVKEP